MVDDFGRGRGGRCRFTVWLGLLCLLASAKAAVAQPVLEVSGTLAAIDRAHADYSFDAVAGEGILVSVSEIGSNTTFWPGIMTTDPNGREVGLDWSDLFAFNPIRIARSGSYAVRVFRGTAAFPIVGGDYRLTIWRVPGTQGTGITNGTVGGTVFRGDVVPYAFTARAGDRVSITIVETGTFTAFTPAFRLLGAQGFVDDPTYVTAAPYSDLPATRHFTPSADGTYIIFVSRWDQTDAGGSYALTLSGAAGLPGARTPIVDLNGDGRGDAFLYNATNGAYAIQVNDGAGGFAATTGFWDPGWQVYPLNLNSDSYTDFFLYDPVRGLWVQARNNAGNGTFTYTSGTFDPGWQIYPADLDGNGVTDVFVYNLTTGLWVKCLVNGAGDFSTFTFGQWEPAWTLTTADLNGDGRDDFHLYNRTSGVWVEAFSQAGIGVFDYPAVGQWEPGWQIAAADLNGDQRTDLFLLNAEGGHVSALGRPGGGFDFVGGLQFTPGWSVFPGDLNHDGRSDLFLYNPVNGLFVEAFSHGGGGFTFPAAGQFDPGWTVNVTDFNADGRADLLMSNVSGVFVQLLNTSDGVFSSSAGAWGTGWKVFTRRPTDC